MRKVILFMHVSLDGYICGPGDEGDWVTMREEPGEDMLIFGGTTLAARFAKHNLIDEYRIKLEPVVLGSGKSLYDSIPDRINLQLVHSKIFESGVAVLYYQVI